MQQQSKGQSIVELALLLPLLLVVVFGIIDFGYFIYGYATIYHAARSATEVASGAPPYYSRIEAGPPYNEDFCISKIIDAAQAPAVLFNNPSFREANAVTISYPDYIVDPGTGDPLLPEDRRQIGYPIEVTVEYDVQPLTPLWQLMPVLDWEDGITIRTTARRSIEGYGRDPTAEDLSACQP